MIPAWIVQAFERAKADALTGSLAVSFKNGTPNRVDKQESFFPPPAPAGVPQCPSGCGPMADYDYGHAFLCQTCGHKKTKAQVDRERISAPRG